MANRWAIEVQRTGRTWGVFGVTFTQTGREQELLEGGFFERAAAVACAASWERECLQSEVEDAERRAGWDASR